MKKQILLIATKIFICYQLIAQTPGFEKLISMFPQSTSGNSVQQTADGGYIIAANTSANLGDAFLVKTNQNGDTAWTKAFGGAANDDAFCVQQTSDNGYIIAGVTASFGAGSSDIYVIKTNSNGTEQWMKTYGGADYDKGSSVQQTSDGGYIIAGLTYSAGAGNADAYLIKINGNGDMLWTKTFGGAQNDEALSIRQTSDNGYIFTGLKDKTTTAQGNLYLVRTDVNGNETWSKTFPAAYGSRGNSVQQTSDGGYIVAGYGWDFGSQWINSGDIYLIKTNSSGDTLWTKVYGGWGADWGMGVRQTADGGYVVAAGTQSFGSGSSNFYLIKTNNNGDTLWTKTFGWASPYNNDMGNSVYQTTDGGYVMAGKRWGTGVSDIILIKTDGNGNVLSGMDELTIKNCLSKIYPNPFTASATLVIVSEAKQSMDNLQFTIYNLLGEEVKQIPIHHLSSAINCQDLADGIYFYKIVAGKEIIGSGKLMIQ